MKTMPKTIMRVNKEDISTINTNPQRFFTGINCRVNSNPVINVSKSPEKTCTTVHLTVPVTTNNKTIQTSIIAHFWGKSATKACVIPSKRNKCNIYGKVLFETILLNQLIGLVEINVIKCVKQ